MNFVRYDSDGKITAIGFCASEDFPLQSGYPASLLEVKESEPVDIDTHFVRLGRLVELPPKPSPNHRFDYQNNIWVGDTISAWADVRSRRNDKLAQSDWTDTASAPARLGQEVYDQWQTYRQALRAVTNQPDPFNIVWPISP